MPTRSNASYQKTYHSRDGYQHQREEEAKANLAADLWLAQQSNVQPSKSKVKGTRKKHRAGPSFRKNSSGEQLVLLKRMHSEMKSYCAVKDAILHKEAFSLLCALGACLGNFPRVRRKTIEGLTQRYGAIMGVE